MFADYHVHSHFSEDTDFPMELEIQKAIKLGMDELCFTEHSCLRIRFYVLVAGKRTKYLDFFIKVLRPTLQKGLFMKNLR